MKSMQLLITLVTLLTLSQASFAQTEVFTGDRTLTCLDYDDANIYFSGKLVYSEATQKYRVRTQSVGLSSTEIQKYDGDSTTTYTNPASGILNFETNGILGARYEMTKGSRKNSYTGSATLKATGATYTVNCTYSGPEFPAQR